MFCHSTIKGLLKLVKYADGSNEQMTYYANDQIETSMDRNNAITTYTYDGAGNIREVTNALGEKTSFTYDRENRLLTTTNPMGYMSSVTYDAVGNVETTTDAKGRTTKTLYNNHGDVKYQYDGDGRLVASMTYGAAYNLESVTDALGHTTTNTYTNMNQLKTSIDPLGHKKIRGYDNRGNLNEVVDPPTLDRAESVVTKALYNANGQVKTITDPEGNVQSYEYDTLGNFKYAHTPFGGTNSYTYNALNLMETAQNARGQKATYIYDAAGRVEKMIDEVDETTYQYDANGNLLKVISKNNGTITRTFDALNRVKTYTDARGNTISYDYDHAGLLTDVIDFKGGVTHYEYDNNGRVKVMTRPNGTRKLLGRTGKTETPFLFNGMYGVETDHNGLYCMRSRYYNPTIMRFINQDVVQGSLDNAVTLNRYAYANGNPVSYIDPFGFAALYDTYHMDENAKTALIRDNRAGDIIKIENDYKARQQQVYKRDCAIESTKQEMARLYKKGKWLDFADGAISFADQFYHACPFVNVIYVTAKGDIGALTDPHFDQAAWEKEWCNTMNGHLAMGIFEGALIKLGIP